MFFKPISHFVALEQGKEHSSVYMITCQIIFMLFFAHYGANQMLGQLYKKVELDLDKIVHKSKYLKKLKLFFDN